MDMKDQFKTRKNKNLSNLLFYHQMRNSDLKDALNRVCEKRMVGDDNEFWAAGGRLLSLPIWTALFHDPYNPCWDLALITQRGASAKVSSID